MRTARLAPLFTGLVVLVFVPSALASPPQPVSPGGIDVALVEVRCPTFSWAPARREAAHELAVYEVSRDGEPAAEPVLSVHLPARARSWTPSLDRCLERGGRYAWSVRELEEGGGRDGRWSEPMLFEVTAAPTVEEVEAALATLRRFRESTGRVPDSVRVSARPRALPMSVRLGGPGKPSAVEPVEPSLAPKAAPTLGQVSLGISDHLALAPGSGIFKDGNILLWSDHSSSNMGVGYRALGDPALTGSGNTALGHQALRDHETSGANTAIGTAALILHVSGSGNTAVGDHAMSGPASGSNNLALGSFAGNNLDGGSGNIMIDSDGVAGDADVTRIGTFQTKTYIAGIHGASLGGSTVKRVCVDETDQIGPCPPTPPSPTLERSEPAAAAPSMEVLVDEIRTLRRQIEEQRRRLEVLEEASRSAGGGSGE